MKPAPFDYRRPGTLAEALAALAGEPNAKVLAGGQSLVPLLSMRLAAPALLVDINGVPGLAAITSRARRTRASGSGALARHADVLASPDVRRVQPLVADGARPRRARDDPQPRHHGRLDRARRRGRRDAGGAALLGGSRRGRPRCADAAPSPPTSCTSARWSRRSRHDEIAVSAFFPALAPGAGVAFEEIARRHGDYALCGVAALSSTAASVRGGYLSVSDVPTVVDLTRRRRCARRLGGGRARRSSSPPTTSTPPPPTAPSWCACSPSAWFARPRRRHRPLDRGHDPTTGGDA